MSESTASEAAVSPLRGIVGCERSRAVAREFEARGHEMLSCDIELPRHEGAHYTGNVFDVIDFPWDIGIFHPPCTHTAVSGSRHFQAKRMDGRLYAGAAFFLALVRRSRHIKGTAFEQPVSIMSTLYRKPDQIIQPWMFGHYETKATCLWLRELPLLVPTYRSSEECREALGIPPGVAPAARIHRMGPSDDRSEKRSETFPGIANAMAVQWGGPTQLDLVGGRLPEASNDE